MGSESEEVVIEPDDVVDEIVAQQALDKSERKKQGNSGQAWSMLLLAVTLMASMSAQEFTVSQHYESYNVYAQLDEKTESTLKVTFGHIDDWAVRPYFTSAAAVLIILPVLWLIETKGPKLTINILSLVGILGVVIKLVASTEVTDADYRVTWAGQVLVSICRIGLLPCIHRLAVSWFGTHFVSLVCAIAFFSDNLGVLKGFFVPNFIYWLHKSNTDLFLRTNQAVFYVMHSLPMVLGLLTLLIKDGPVEAPSMAEDLRRKTEPADPDPRAFLKRTKVLFLDINLILHTISFAVNFGVTTMTFHPTRLTVLFVHDKEQDLGLTATAIIIFAGYMGAVISGLLLARTRQYHLMASATYLAVFVFHIILVIAIHSKETTTFFFAVGGMGFFFSAYLTSALEYAAEKWYPALESTITGIMIAAGFVVAGLFTVTDGAYPMPVEKATLTGYISGALLSIGLLFTAGLDPSALKRTGAGDDSVH